MNKDDIIKVLKVLDIKNLFLNLIKVSGLLNRKIDFDSYRNSFINKAEMKQKIENQEKKEKKDLENT